MRGVAGARGRGGSWAWAPPVVALLFVTLACAASGSRDVRAILPGGGLWAPATLFLYLTSLLVIGGVAGRVDALPRRHWRFVAVVYGVMGLDEIDSSGGSMVSMPGGSTT